MGNESKENPVKNTKAKDNGNKLVFGNATLCAQFLRGYTDIEMLKIVQPEDIEDISERCLPMWQEGRDSDTVKKIRLDGESLYLIAIIEHQSDVYYDMAFKLLRYIVMVLTDYEAEQEKLYKGITKTKDFKYPPILPVVYYEGTESWTAVRSFKDRVHLSDVFGKYIPDFEYLLVPLTSYSNQELIQKNDELSLIMLINKLRSSADFKKLQDIPPEYFENLTQNTPEYLLNLISKIVAVFLYRLNIPKEEVEQFTDLIGRREFGMMFDSFEVYDVQEIRRISRAEGEARGEARGEIKGDVKRIITQTLKKLAKNHSVPEIADMLEEDEALIQRICNIKAANPDSNEEEVWNLLCNEHEES